LDLRPILEASADLTVAGELVSCETGNEVIDGMDMTAGLYGLWINSNPDGDMLDRREAGGWVMKDEFDRYEVFMWSTQGSACAIEGYGTDPPSWAGQVVGFIHTHPWMPGDMIPVCGEDGNPTGEWTEYPGGPSNEDILMSWDLGSKVDHPDKPGPLPGYILDGAGIIVFRGFDPVTMFDRCGF
jgi:hypothetical protein